MRESTLNSHLCTPKRRALQQNEKRVRLGYYTFNQFYRLSAGAKSDKSYEEFCKSNYYNAFVKFGSFLSNVKPLYIDKYITYIVTSGIKIDKWCDESIYENYVIDLIRKEGVESALERSINTMVEWATENHHNWTDYFNLVSVNRAVWNIKDGKISPWLILNCQSGKSMLSKFNDEQLQMIYRILDPEHWSLRFKRQKADLILVKDIIQKANI